MSREYFYYEPRTGTVYGKQPERRNVYKIEDTPENRAGLEAAQKGSNEFLLAWLRDNETPEEDDGEAAATALAIIRDALRASRDERIRDVSLDGDHKSAEIILTLDDENEGLRDFVVKVS